MKMSMYKSIMKGVWALLALALLSTVPLATARPRPILPPVPEIGGPASFHEGFDWVSGTTNAEVVISGYGTLKESWSGYALQRSGTVTPFIVPAINAQNYTNWASQAESAVRLWFMPYWVSQSEGGSGPGTVARLVELVATDGQSAASVWSLQITADGNALALLAETQQGAVELLRAPIAWEGGPHCIALNFGAAGIALFIDGALVDTGEETISVPPSTAGLVMGSSWSGSSSVAGELEEVSIFRRSLSERAIAAHYTMYRDWAARGPVSEAEWQAKWNAIANGQLQDGGGAEMMLLVGGTSQCITNVPVYITNVVAVLNTNVNTTTVTFDIQGGTNGLFYDIFTTERFTGSSGTNSQWFWLERGPTCSTYQYAGQPVTNSFYVVGATNDLDGDGMTDAWEQLVSKTPPNVAQPPFKVFILQPGAGTFWP